MHILILKFLRWQTGRHNILNQMVVGTCRTQSALKFFMARMPQYILIFHNDNCDEACSYSRHKSCPVETPCQKDVWWNGHILLTFLKPEQMGQLHAPAIVLLGTFRYVT